MFDSKCLYKNSTFIFRCLYQSCRTFFLWNRKKFACGVKKVNGDWSCHYAWHLLFRRRMNVKLVWKVVVLSEWWWITFLSWTVLLIFVLLVMIMCDNSLPSCCCFFSSGNWVCQSSEPLARWQSRPCWPLHVDANLWRWRFATSVSLHVRSPLHLMPAFILCLSQRRTTLKSSSQVWKTMHFTYKLESCTLISIFFRRVVIGFPFVFLVKYLILSLSLCQVALGN